MSIDSKLLDKELDKVTTEIELIELRISEKQRNIILAVVARVNLDYLLENSVGTHIVEIIF